MVGIFLCIRKVLKGRRRVLTRTIFDEDGVFQGIQHIRLHPPMVCVYSMFSDIMGYVCVLLLVLFRQQILDFIASRLGRERDGRARGRRDGEVVVRRVVGRDRQARDRQTRGGRDQEVVPRWYNLRPR